MEVGEEVDLSDTVEEEKRKGFCLDVGEDVWIGDAEVGEDGVNLDAR